ncbi:MAG: hypothetical protein HWE24_09985 [Oceanospirillaceae bacterium]|nr:hypothetical protein [Oceanospirillaceae bacterium]
MSRIYKKSNFAGTNASTGIAFGGSSKEKAAACTVAGTVLATYSPYPVGKAVGIGIGAATTYLCTQD